jgi:hypothetical protein
LKAIVARKRRFKCRLFGKIKVVEHFPDYKIKYVEHFPGCD